MHARASTWSTLRKVEPVSASLVGDPRLSAIGSQAESPVAGGSSHACLGARCKRFGRLSRAEFPDFAGEPWRMMIIASASSNANSVRSCTRLSPIPILVSICTYRCLICPETSISGISVLARAIPQLLSSCVPATHSSNQVTATGAPAVRLSGTCKTSSSFLQLGLPRPDRAQKAGPRTCKSLQESFASCTG